jgi:hypothetical protein
MIAQHEKTACIVIHNLPAWRAEQAQISWLIFTLNFTGERGNLSFRCIYIIRKMIFVIYIAMPMHGDKNKEAPFVLAGSLGPVYEFVCD